MTKFPSKCKIFCSLSTSVKNIPANRIDGLLRMMLRRQIFIINAVLIAILWNQKSVGAKSVAATTEVRTAANSTSAGHNTLLKDLQWFFDGLATGADIVENYLPEVSTEQQRGVETFTYSQLVDGLKYFLSGIKDISTSVVKTLNQREARQYQQFPMTSALIKLLEDWFRQLRLLFVRIVELYKLYLPELMLGKCVGKYLIFLYPNSAFYEYPYLIAYDFYVTIVYGKERPVDSLEFNGEELSNTDDKVEEEHLVEHNEIIDRELYEFPSSSTTTTKPNSIKTSRNIGFSREDNRTAEQILRDDVAELNSWPKCLKLYTAETIFRNLEFYFFS